MASWSKRLGTALLTGFVLLSAGCVTVRYQSFGSRSDGVGYYEIRSSAKTWKVVFCGDGSFGEKVMRDLVYLRAAEIAVREGARYFVVREEHDYSRKALGGAPVHVVSSSATSGIGVGPVSGPARMPSPYRTSVGDEGGWIQKLVLQIELVPDINPLFEPGTVFEAEPLSTRLRAKYRLP